MFASNNVLVMIHRHLNPVKKTIETADQETIRIIRLSREEAYNAISEQLMYDLSAALQNAEEDDSVHAILLTGSGKAFCAGGDLATLEEYTRHQDTRFENMVADFHRLVEQIKSLTKPIVAYINGPATGGGFSLAMACDMRLMNQGAFLKTGYASIGLTPDGGWSQTVVRQIGTAKAMELFLLDEKVEAQQALQFGLVNRLVSGEVWDEVMGFMNKVARTSLQSFGSFKTLLSLSAEDGMSQQLSAEQSCISRAAFSSDFSEGLSAFKERRKPVFNQVSIQKNYAINA